MKIESDKALQFVGVGKKYITRDRTSRGPAQNQDGTQSGVVKALIDINFSLDAGEFVALQGPSGCGKTSLLLIAGLLLQPSQGEIHFFGQDLYRLSKQKQAQIRASQIGFVFQQFHLIPYLSAWENVQVAISEEHLRTNNLALSKQRVLELLQRLKVDNRSDHLPSQLSIGERQRVALARALINKPKLLLADEATGNLDNESAAIVLDVLEEQSKVGVSVLMATHDAKSAERAGRIVRMQAGRIVTSV